MLFSKPDKLWRHYCKLPTHTIMIGRRAPPVSEFLKPTLHRINWNEPCLRLRCRLTYFSPVTLIPQRLTPCSCTVAAPCKVSSANYHIHLHLISILVNSYVWQLLIYSCILHDQQPICPFAHSDFSPRATDPSRCTHYKKLCNCTTRKRWL